MLAEHRSEGLARTRLFHLGARAREVVRPRRSVVHVVDSGQGLKSDGSCWVLSGLLGVPWGSVGNRIFHRPSQATSAKSGFRRVSVGALIWQHRPRQGLTDHSTVPYRCTTKIRTSQGPYGSPTGRRKPHRDLTGPRRPVGLP